MKLTDFKVLTFDVVGTLIDFERGVLASVRRLGGPAAKDLTDDQIFEPYMRGRATHPGRSSHEMANVYLSLAKELGLPDDAQSAAAFQRDVLEWPAFADSVAALKRLRKHFRLVAMTNADRVALSAYAHTLGDPFDDTVCCDETGVAKPDPQFFAYNRGRQAAFGYKFGEILHTAQSQYHDIGVATELGYATCWIERRQGKKGFGATPVPEAVTTPTFTFPTLAELADAVEAEARLAA
ncbi:HAD-IA family hydrolase [Paraburkholderia nemoris]|uniref:Haloacetate dehalogenase H-2 n=1 Tax=Paraburkholderia aspalathi TaxID=1324617 RepID=A0A1I7EJP7_9BURK|nr:MULTISPECIES: HAD-IA family hydrolase [Paraburkholderia]KPD14889.1 2-haloalkanoic acid dehalogenase [Burkholderia sp. ST111]MBK3738927.1 HAD-IA family hydrolase [Paraburkholderia aspalathi]MBK3785494.1 HAD-IA family hydrolase [Paraburkholderia aspalathi]MBK3820437.1 HAD-IA family hydrolase [Paraburkholderia aspalathi]MBK3832255.1 HAD-IA family hydrolase [Paraburkholderia aspalathi]